jgi:hypothetical protein
MLLMRWLLLILQFHILRISEYAVDAVVIDYYNLSLLQQLFNVISYLNVSYIQNPSYPQSHHINGSNQHLSPSLQYTTGILKYTEYNAYKEDNYMAL